MRKVVHNESNGACMGPAYNGDEIPRRLYMSRKDRKPVEQMTETELAIQKALKDKKNRRKAAKRAELVEALTFVVQNAEDPDLVAKAKRLLPRDAGGTGPVYVAGVRKNLIVETLKSLFADGLTAVTEDDAWQKLRLDRSSMRKKCVLAIKKAKPEERVWVSFNATTGIYTLEGEGPNPPEGWLGYVPVDVEE